MRLPHPAAHYPVTFTTIKVGFSCGLGETMRSLPLFAYDVEGRSAWSRFQDELASSCWSLPPIDISLNQCFSLRSSLVYFCSFHIFLLAVDFDIWVFVKIYSTHCPLSCLRSDCPHCGCTSGFTSKNAMPAEVLRLWMELRHSSAVRLNQRLVPANTLRCSLTPPCARKGLNMTH